MPLEYLPPPMPILAMRLGPLNKERGSFVRPATRASCWLTSGSKSQLADAAAPARLLGATEGEKSYGPIFPRCVFADLDWTCSLAHMLLSLSFSGHVPQQRNPNQSEVTVSHCK